jgi:glycosyltransferase involved in cell wall biosynthesis
LAEYYRAASFCVLSSYFESHGMVILEATGCGRVTLGSDVGSMREFCPAELLTAPGDAAALARNLEALVLDVQHARSVCATACRKARDNFTLVQSVAEVEKVYMWTLHGKLSG